jgi:hypothetical protein
MNSITVLAGAGQYFIAAHFLIFFMITIMFYTIGSATFLYEAYAKQKI